MSQHTAEAQPTPKRFVGYVRVPAAEPAYKSQLQQLRAAGCDRIFEEQPSPSSSARPVLTRLLRDLTTGDTLVVAGLDSLALPVDGLGALIEDFERRGVSFMSTGDKIDTSAPHGMYFLRILSAVVKLDKTLHGESTKAGIAAARRRGSLPGNPGLRDRRPEAILAASQARNKVYLDQLIGSAETWLPTVQRLRPDHSWDNIVRVLNRRGMEWTVERLRRAVRRMIDAKLAEPSLLARSPRRTPDDRLMTLIAAIAIADPALSLRGIAAQLDLLGETPLHGGKKWQPSSVRNLMEEARRFGLLRP